MKQKKVHRTVRKVRRQQVGPTDQREGFYKPLSVFFVQPGRNSFRLQRVPGRVVLAGSAFSLVCPWRQGRSWEGLPHLRYEIDRPLFSVGAWSFLKEVSFSKSLAPKTFFLCLSLVFVSTTNSNLVELLLSCVLVVSVLIRCLEKHLCHCSICSYQNTLEFILRVAILV